MSEEFFNQGVDTMSNLINYYFNHYFPTFKEYAPKTLIEQSLIIEIGERFIGERNGEGGEYKTLEDVIKGKIKEHMVLLSRHYICMMDKSELLKSMTYERTEKDFINGKIFEKHNVHSHDSKIEDLMDKIQETLEVNEEINKGDAIGNYIEITFLTALFKLDLPPTIYF